MTADSEEYDYDRAYEEIIETEFNRLKDRFMNNGGFIAFGETEDESVAMGISYIKDLNIVVYSDYIYAENVYDCIISCNESYAKANSIEEAWEQMGNCLYSELEDKMESFSYDELIESKYMVYEYFDQLTYDRYSDGALLTNKSPWHDDYEAWELEAEELANMEEEIDI